MASAEQLAQQMQVVKDLMARGKKNGKLTLKEIADTLSPLELETDQIDKVYEMLENEGIEIEGAGVLDVPLGDDDEQFAASAVEEVPEEELVDTSALAEGFASTTRYACTSRRSVRLICCRPKKRSTWHRRCSRAIRQLRSWTQ